MTALRARVANVVAGAIRIAPAPLADTHDFAQAPASGAIAGHAATARTMTGIDVLQAEGFGRLAGRKVGLLTNHTGRTRGGQSTIDAFHAAKNLTLVALFSPEHGIRGILDEEIPSSVDEKTGLTIDSLYGKTRRATPEMLQGIDTMVVDLQDIGSRFYTYMSSLGYLLEAAAPLGIEVVVLDRPNPINGWQIEGPRPDPLPEGAERSFIAYFPTMPVRHGMTLGELAKLFNDERKIGAKLTVVEMKGWSREEWWDETALMWVNPSPNMRSLAQATLYPGIGAVEYANLSVGRGTDAPFERIGAPWIDGLQLAEALNTRNLPGIRFYPILFTPSSSVYKGEECQGVYFIISDRSALRPVRVGLELVSVISKLFPGKLDFEADRELVRIGRSAGTRADWRGPRTARGAVGRRRSQLAHVAGEVPDLPVAATGLPATGGIADRGSRIGNRESEMGIGHRPEGSGRLSQPGGHRIRRPLDNYACASRVHTREGESHLRHPAVRAVCTACLRIGTAQGLPTADADGHAGRRVVAGRADERALRGHARCATRGRCLPAC